MYPSLRLILVGVGAVLAFSQTATGVAETVPRQSQNPTKSSDSTNTVTPPLSKASSTQASQAAPPENIVVPTIAKPTSDVAQAQPEPLSPSPAPTPTPITPTPSSSQPIGPAKAGAAPEYLNANPNPLQFPTNPEEVRLRGIQPITLQQAVELAERNSRNLQVLRLQLDRSQAALREAQAELLPSVTLQTAISRSKSPAGQIQQEVTQRANEGLPPFLQQPANQDTTNSGLSGTIALSYDVFTSGRRPAQIRAAARQVRSDELQVEVTREQLRQDVTTDYYDLQEADESVRINAAAVRNNEISLRDTQALERAGLGTRFEVLQAEVQLANSRQQLTNSRSQQQIRRRRLAQRLNLPFAIDLAAADPVQLAGEWKLPLEDSLILAFKNRAELEQQLVQRELSEQQRRAVLAALGPTITLSYQYQVQDSFDDNVGFGDGYTLSAGVRWNVFEGGAARARARQQEANIAIAETRFADARDQVRFQVEQSYSSLTSSFENIATATTALGQAQEALRLARLRFQAGVGTQSQVIDAETELTRAEGNRVNAILGYNRSLAALQRAVSNVPPSAAIPTDPTPTPIVPSPGTVPPASPTPSTPPTQL